MQMFFLDNPQKNYNNKTGKCDECRIFYKVCLGPDLASPSLSFLNTYDESVDSQMKVATKVCPFDRNFPKMFDPWGW